MNKTPRSLRLHIGLFGRTNVGKSSFLNMVAGQDVALTSPVPGTTTDVVEKAMELLPVGPVVFLDTGGINDTSELGEGRVGRTRRALDRADVAVLMVEPDQWTPFEDEMLREFAARKVPVIAVVNKADTAAPSPGFLDTLRGRVPRVLVCSSARFTGAERDRYVSRFKQFVLEVCPDSLVAAPKLLGDLVPPGGLVVLIIPIDKEAPKGRIILPQVQAIRDALDHGEVVAVCRETEYAALLSRLARPPDLVVCDSQVVSRMVAETPPGVKCTTFSILFSRYRGDLLRQTVGVTAVGRLKPGDRVLIAEACTHHAVEDDIGRVKIPRWLKQHLGFDVGIDVCSGRDWPEEVGRYSLAVLCGACMLTHREVLARIEKAAAAGVPVTNYGICISLLQGVLPRVLEPFPEAAAVLEESPKPEVADARAG
jgi:[FeFe] hydrogenase H-cluster maturation GTPase HydF